MPDRRQFLQLAGLAGVVFSSRLFAAPPAADPPLLMLQLATQIT